jgi:endonuclease/exonuclease/phosphatase family metal-dependent hydrolase
MIRIKILNWNAAGAKFLERAKAKREEFKREMNRQLQRLSEDHGPDFMVLQETARYGNISCPEDLIDPPLGYYYKTSIAIDTEKQTHPSKWKRFRERGRWASDAYLAQGYGILWRQEIHHCPIWDFTPRLGPDIQVEEVHLDTGLYTGDRSTEPRLAVVAHFVLFGPDEVPLDIFIVNLHLTTLKGEREGLPERDDLGSRIRRAQIDTVLHGIVSRYNEWRAQTETGASRMPAMWVLAGDFNCTPDSPEIAKLSRMNFLDLNPHKGTGTKAKGLAPSGATIAVDYVFAGPKYVALSPYITKRLIEANPKPLYTVAVSDHFPLIAELPILVPVS